MVIYAYAFVDFFSVCLVIMLSINES